MSGFEVTFDFFNSIDWQAVGAFAVALLAFINGVFLFKNHIADRPKLKVSRVHTDGFAWWVRFQGVMLL